MTNLLTNSMLGLGALLSVTFGLAGAPRTAHAQYAQPVDAPEWQGDGSEYAAPQYEQAPVSSFNYFGQHPIPYDQGGGFCQHTGAHVHNFPVFDQHLFREVNGFAYFVGDPTDFSYANAAYAYQGNHPLDDAYGGGYCYMGWSHRHLFAPTSSMFSYSGGVYMYTGGWSADYYTYRPRFASYFDDYYRRTYYGNRYFAARPAHVYAGAGWRWGSNQPVYRAPGYRAPAYRAPVYRAPVYGAPAYRSPSPVYRAPVYGAPAYRAPSPVYRAPVYNAPAYRAPSPVYRAPVYNAPAYRSPSPVYRAPAYSAPAAPMNRGPAHFSSPAVRPAPAFQAHYGRR